MKIEKICWKYEDCENSQKASLTICIDNIKLVFEGLTATTLYLALQKPYDGIEYEDAPLKSGGNEFANKRRYDALYRRIDDINIRLLIEYPEYNLTDFLVRDLYEYKINPKYADFVEPY